MDHEKAGEKRLLELNQLDEWRTLAYDSATLYKERMKKWHDKHILPTTFVVGQKVLLYNSRLRLFPGKLRSRWTGPYVIQKVHPFGAVDLIHPEGRIFKVNGHRLKPYIEGYKKDDEEVTYLTDPGNENSGDHEPETRT